MTNNKKRNMYRPNSGQVCTYGNILRECSRNLFNDKYNKQVANFDYYAIVFL